MHINNRGCALEPIQPAPAPARQVHDCRFGFKLFRGIRAGKRFLHCIINQLSDRERLGLRAPVKSVSDDRSTTEFDRDGGIAKWTGNKAHGYVQRTYDYEEA